MWLTWDMSDHLPLTGVLETVLYCTTENEEPCRRFYEEILGLRRISHWGYRLGPHVFLLFNSDETHDQKWPPPHGATGPGHICFTVAPEGYEGWKEHLTERKVEVIEEIDWSRGIHSFYFRDPADNVLEIANGDMWPA